jgi:hypothetical protein
MFLFIHTNFQIEKIQDGTPGLYRVTSKMDDGTEVVDEYNTVIIEHNMVKFYTHKICAIFLICCQPQCRKMFLFYSVLILYLYCGSWIASNYCPICLFDLH